MAWTVRFSKTADKAIRKLDKQVASSVLDAIEEISKLNSLRKSPSNAWDIDEEFCRTSVWLWGACGQAMQTGPGVPNTPAVHISDLARVAPQQPVLQMEPNGWALLHQPTNFWTTATGHTTATTLAGQPVTVTFNLYEAHTYLRLP